MGRKKRILHPTSARKQNYYAELTFGKGGEAAGSERRATIFGVFFFLRGRHQNSWSCSSTQAGRCSRDDDIP